MRRPTIKPAPGDRVHRTSGSGDAPTSLYECTAPNGKGCLLSLRQHPTGAFEITIFRADTGITINVDDGTAKPVATIHTR